MKNSKVNFFHIGPQKTATTWLYNCLKEHPEVSVASRDAIQFFDINYHLGEDWFESKFPETTGIKVETSPSYIRSRLSLERIKHYNNDAKIIFCIRNPVERMLSHFWHEKKKNSFSYELQDVFNNYDLFSSWIEPSFYAQKYELLIDIFGKENILVQVYDDLVKSPEDYIKDTYEFLGVIDSSFSPQLLNRKVNQATVKKSKSRLFFIDIFTKIGVIDTLLKVKANIFGLQTTKGIKTEELIDKLSKDDLDRIKSITRFDVEKLSSLIQRDLTFLWGYHK
ncbi:sulfotransferase domain-containing protein [Vibrio lamellibrachiae]|uniref:sulfotransferase family protein n=1 Tax=Vibrio lamellibrachiae TaxID=2910253 RepID=UPI003D123254